MNIFKNSLGTDTFGREVAKLFISTTVATAGSLVGVFGGLAAIGKIVEHFENRSEKTETK